MNQIDISILKQKPDLTERVVLEIEPLAPLSMVSDLPGSFYKSLKSPSKKMLCGLFENMLGWHIDIADRKTIQKDLIKGRQKGIKDKEKKKAIKTKIEGLQQGSTYIPLLMEYFEIELVTVPPMIHYNDLWSRSFRRMDSAKHAAGSEFMNAEFIAKWSAIEQKVKTDTKRKSARKNTLLDNLFKRYSNNFPMYYTTPTTREFFDYGGKITITISLDESLRSQLDITTNDSLTYIGNSEGWVSLQIKNRDNETSIN